MNMFLTTKVVNKFIKAKKTNLVDLHFHNILILFYLRVNFLFPTSKTKRDY